MSGAVYLIDRELTQHGPWHWEGELPPNEIERLRPRIGPTSFDLPDSAIPLDRVLFRLVASSGVTGTLDWAAIYSEEP